MADTPVVEDTEITLDDFNADDKATESTPVKEEAQAEPVKEEKVADKGKTESETETEGNKEVVADDTAETSPDETEPQGDKPLAPKSENRFQKMANENRSLREQVEKLTGDVYQPQTAEELSDMVNPETGENYTKSEARVVALEQKLELKDYNERVTGVQSFLGAESYEVLDKFPVFNPDDKEHFDPELAEIASETMEANLIRDPNVPEIGPDGQPTGLGLIIGYNKSPKQIYTNLARIHGVSTTKGQIKGQQDTEKQLANVDAGGNAAPPTVKEDPLMKLWKED
jgi:hypothetical protein